MAHVLYTPTQAARATLAGVRYLSVLPRLVRQDFSQEFIAGRGRTVDIPLPITLGAARNYTDANRAARAAIVFDDLDQDTVPVTMDTQVYSAVRLPDDFNTFTLTSLTEQVLKPQAQVVATGIVAPLTAVVSATAVGTGGEAVANVLADGTNVRATLINVRRILNARTFNGVLCPQTDRVIVVGTDVEAAILSDPLLQKANEAGDGGDMLRTAVIGRIFGFTIVVDPNLAAKTAVAFHKDAFVHVTRPSRSPEGAAKSATVSQDGFSLRWIQHYNPTQLEDQSVVDAFVGAQALIPAYAIKFLAA